MVHLVSALVIIFLLGVVECQSKTNNTGSTTVQKWGYVDVRKDAHMFYGLYYTSHPDGFKNRPWIIWLQGGPGGSGCGYGNFYEIGPQKPDRQPRNTTWVKQASVLFIDSPVGAGFSYVDDESAYNTKDSEIIDDLIVFLGKFLEKTPIFKTRPLYIFGQSYGGKVAALLSRRLHDEIRLGNITAKLIGLAMGNAWISPLDSVLNYADFAFWMSLVDENGRRSTQQEAEKMKAAIERGNWTEASECATETQAPLLNLSNRVDTYDISKFVTDQRKNLHALLLERMEGLQNSKLGKVPKNITWSESFDAVFDKLSTDFAKPAVSVVDDILKTTDLQVIVYQGQLDLICNTKGAMDWVQKLTWSNLTNYTSSVRKAFTNPVDNQTEAFVKAYGKFKFYTILGSGHAVPHDKGDAAYRMLDRILNNLDQ